MLNCVYLPFMFILVLGEDSKIFDVTTIFDAKKPDEWGHVHLRTNALGLPLYNETDIVPQTSPSYNITCDLSEFCNWNTNGWKTYTTHGNREIKAGQKKSFKLNSSWALKIKESTKFDGIERFLIFTTDNPSYLRNVEFFMISFQKTYISLYRNCVNKIHSYRDYSIRTEYNGEYLTVSCWYKENIRIFGNGEYILTKSTSGCCNYNYYFNLYRGSSLMGQYGYQQNVSYVYPSDLIPRIELIFLEKVTMYSSEIEDSEMVSPVIHADSTKLCLVIEYYSQYKLALQKDVLEKDCYIDLNVLAEDESGQRHHLKSIYNEEAGWKLKKLDITLPERLRQLKLVIKKASPYIVNVTRIATCNPDGEDVEVIPYTYQNYQDGKFSLYSADSRMIVSAEVEYNNIKNCLNGGVLTVKGCACAPGFYGTECQSGCGQNRFGQDCEGKCSIWKQECEGLLLCTKYTNCSCAPGYHGEHCNQKCSAGWYGNNCSQHCGHCAKQPFQDTSCDIYTGECSSCMFGYLPPYCKDESVYYSAKPTLISPKFGIIEVTFDSTNYKAKQGIPVLYQIQYREKEQNKTERDWITLISKEINRNRTISFQPWDYMMENLITEQITALRDGVYYQVRVLLMDSEFNKYDGDLVQVSEILTKCVVPEVVDYHVIAKSTSSSLDFTWEYKNTTDHWCPVEGYEVFWKGTWKWLSNSTTSKTIKLDNLLPGSKVHFKLRAKTVGGFAPFSPTILAYTTQPNSSAVRNLHAESTSSTSADISWDPPIDGKQDQLQYIVTYKCVDQPACSLGCQNVSEGQITVKDNRATLTILSPFTRYRVSVAPQNGPENAIFLGTPKDVPSEVPIQSDLTPVTTNTSVTVFWEKPVVCSSYLLGYNYQLFEEKDLLKVLDSGFTTATSVSFHNLTARNMYQVRVFVSTIAGFNPNSFLDIKVSTSATVPDTVRNLTVYKRGKGMLGLRWAPPLNTYGQLKSFTVSFNLGQEVTSHTVEPSHCVVWPELYCFTLEGLRSNRRYNVTVSARNVEVTQDGQETTVTGVTKESPPTSPANLKRIKSTPFSLTLQWNYPELANGIVRSFVISVEETESFDQESCCQIYPLVESAVKDEQPTYDTEVSGLHPASTYFVSVSAKTVGMGPAQSIVAYTQPPHLPFPDSVLPRVEAPSVEELTWLPQQQEPDVNSSDIYATLVKAHLVLAVVNESQPLEFHNHSGIVDSQLETLLQEMIGSPFFFLAEYNEEDLVSITSSLEDMDSEWGKPPPSLPTQKYQLIAAQISVYNGVHNADLRYSQTITLIDF